MVESGLSYAILRPTVIYGREDILVKKHRLVIRRFPVFGIPGDGRYGVRAIYVEDMARLMVDAVELEQNTVHDAIGPETFTFEELVQLIAASVGRTILAVKVPAFFAYQCTRLTGLLMREVVLTWEECKALMSDLLAPQGHLRAIPT